MDDNIDVVCRQLCQSIDVVMDSNSGQQLRHECNQLIDSFKSSDNPLMTYEVSLKLLQQSSLQMTNKSVAYKLFGFQTLNNVIKYHWNSMDDNLKNQLKQLMQSWFNNDMSSQDYPSHEWRHLMNASGRCVVEVVIREWPQNWPQFMSYLLQRESYLSLYCIWQLTEEVGVFFRPNNPQRRREMTNELNKHMTDIYAYIGKCFTSGDINLCLISLNTLNVMLEWTQLDATLLNNLMQLLAIDYQNDKCHQIKQLICDCLLTCLSRKLTKDSDKNAIKVLFSDNNISLIISNVGKYLEINSKDQDVQTLLKRLVSLLSLVGQQLVIDNNSNQISTVIWNQYISVIFILFTNDNIILNDLSIQFWIVFVKNYKRLTNNHMSIDTNIFNNLLVNIAHKIVKPMFNQSLLGFEFDDNKDFDHFFLKVRTDTLELLKHLTVLDQNLCLVFVGQSIEKSLNESNSDPKNWEILAQLSAAVFNKISDKRQFCIESETLLKSLIDKCNKDNPNVISSQLSCISALTVFLPNISNHLLNQIIERTLLLATFTLTNETIKSKEVKDLRRHSCSLFIKICQTYPTLLVPLFTTIRQYIGLNNENFSQMEKCSLNEGLLLISNEFENIEHQKLFAKELIDTIVWINSYKPNPNDFICDIGLNVDSIDDVVLSQRRANLSYVVNLTLSFLKRIKTERSVVFIPNIFPVIDGLFNLISNLNTIWRSEYQQKCCVNYKNMVYADISETDKKNILDQPLSDVSEMLTKSAAYRMQIFVWNLHENCYATLGVATSVLQPHFYDQICDFKLIFTDIEFLPQWKLRMIARSFVRPFITNCPQNQIMFNKIESILSLLLQYLFNNLNVKWDEIKARNQLSETDDMKDKSDPIETEVISDEINRLLSREFIDIMVAILTPSKVTQSCDTSDMNSNSFDTKISDLGNYLLNVIPNVIIYPIAKTLSWIDTNIALKTAQLNQLLIQKIISDNMIKSENAVYFLFEQLISGLSYFGEHEQNQSILLQLVLTLYEGIAIKMGFDSIKQQLSQITGSSLKDWIDFDQKLHKTCEPNTKYVLTDKKKKEIIKKLLSQVIGKNIGQLYKYQSVEIKNLKPIFYTKNNRQNTLDDDISLCLLFSD